jgi:hypothetical protein
LVKLEGAEAIGELGRLAASLTPASLDVVISRG